MSMTFKCLDCFLPGFWKDLLPALLEGHGGALLTDLTLVMDAKCIAAAYKVSFRC